MRHALLLTCFLALAACAAARTGADDLPTETLREDPSPPQPTDGLGDILPATCTYPEARRAANRGRDLETVIRTWGDVNPPVDPDIDLALLLRAYEMQLSEAEEAYLFHCLGVDVTLPP